MAGFSTTQDVALVTTAPRPLPPRGPRARNVGGVEPRGTAPTTPVRLGRAARDVGCTLPAEQLPTRLDDWRDALVGVTGREPIDGGIRLTLDPTASVGPLAELAVAERGCCGFLDFALVVDGRGTALEVRAPEDAAAVVDVLFGMPDDRGERQ